MAVAADRSAGQQHVLLGNHQSIIQRTFGAKNLKEAQKGAVFAGFLKIMTPLIIVVPGVICALAYPGQDWGNGNSAYPMLVSEVMPKPVLGFFAAVMLVPSCPRLTRC